MLGSVMSIFAGSLIPDSGGCSAFDLTNYL